MARSIRTRLREGNNTAPILGVIPASLLPIVEKMVESLAQDRPTTTELLQHTKSPSFLSKYLFIDVN